MSNFVEDHNGETLEIAEASLVWSKDPFLQNQERCWGAYCLVGIDQGKCRMKEEGGEEDEENIPIIQVMKPRTSGRKTSKSELKGKGIAILDC